MKTLLASAAALLSVLALAACGSSSSGGGGSATAASSSNDRDTARLKLQDCLRKQGINVPNQPGLRQLSATERQKTQAALQGPCKKYAQNAFGNQTPEERQAFQDAFAKFSACMRQHGVDVPNFTPGQGPPAGGQRLNRNTPKFQAAQKACADLRPQRPGGGGPGGAGGGGGAPS
jgi:hypothetical protein